MAPITLSQTTIETKITTKITTKTVTELKDSQKLFIHHVRHVGRQTTPQRNATLEPGQPRDNLPGTEDRVPERTNQNDPNEISQVAAQN